MLLPSDAHGVRRHIETQDCWRLELPGKRELNSATPRFRWSWALKSRDKAQAMSLSVEATVATLLRPGFEVQQCHETESANLTERLRAARPDSQEKIGSGRYDFRRVKLSLRRKISPAIRHHLDECPADRSITILALQKLQIPDSVPA
jgi:hypothetical protein